MRRAAVVVGAFVATACLDERPTAPSDEPDGGRLSPATAWLEVGDSLTLDTGGQGASLRVSPDGIVALAGRTVRALRPGAVTIEALFPVGRDRSRITVVPPTQPLTATLASEGLTETSFLGIWSANSMESFAVGIDGVVVRTTDGGATWEKMAVPSSADFTAVWGTSPTDVFVVGSEGTILRWNGQTWRKMVVPTRDVLLDVWGLGPDRVYAVGVNAMLQYDGAFWETMPGPTTVELWSVWGTSPSDLFAVGQNGDLLHWDGALWVRMPSPTPFVLFGVWGFSPTDVYAVGIRGLVLHYDGLGWTPVAVPSRADFFAVSATRRNDIMVVGNNGTVLTYNGAAWTQTPQVASSENLRAIAFDGAGGVRVAGWAGTVIERRPSGWRNQLTAPILLAAVADKKGEYFVGSAGAVYRRQGTGVARVIVPTRRDLFGLARLADGRLVVVGDSGTVISSSDGVIWAIEAVPTRALLRSIWADPSDPNVAYVVGAQGTILRRGAGGWSAVPSPRPVFYRHVHGVSSSEILAVGDSGTVVRSESGAFVTMTTPTTARLRGVWGTRSDDLLAVGEQGVAIRFDGRTWSSVATGTTNELRAVAGLGPTNTYAVGFDGTVLRYDGVRFRSIASPTRAFLLGMTIDPAGRLAAVGTNRTVLDLEP
ncbi:MAG: hypothetical protein ACKVZ0_07520 [Gemmatimonadales bacterium]